MKYLYAYPEKCTGCRLCAIACSLKKFGECTPKKGAIGIARDEFAKFEFPFICLQCEDPECVAACMTGAMFRDESNIVRRDEDKCIGCRMCSVACPYGAINTFKGEIIKCDLCDGDPLCVKFCSTNAIVYEEENKELHDRRRRLVEVLSK